MATGYGSDDAAQEQQRRDRMREEYDCGLDNVPTGKQEREMRERGENPYEDDPRPVRANGAPALSALWL